MDLRGEEISIIGEYGPEVPHFNLMNRQLDLLIASLEHKHYQYGIQSKTLPMKKTEK